MFWPLSIWFGKPVKVAPKVEKAYVQATQRVDKSAHAMDALSQQIARENEKKTYYAQRAALSEEMAITVQKMADLDAAHANVA